MGRWSFSKIIMQKTSVKNILQFVISNPSRSKELFKKIRLRFSQREKKRDLKWIKAKQHSFKDWAQNVNADVWNEAVLFSEQLQHDATKKLASLPVKLGGGGLYPVLYFLTIYTKPKIIVETGVAAGYSTQTFLTAINKNGVGKLFSSDFPYFRLPNPEQYVGILVDEELKKNWSLYIEGDKKNIPFILSQVHQIDLFHYDSDKSYGARQSIFEEVKTKLSKDAYILFDDIQDNNHFKDFVANNSCEYHVFEFGGKYIGLIKNLQL